MKKSFKVPGPGPGAFSVPSLLGGWMSLYSDRATLAYWWMLRRPRCTEMVEMVMGDWGERAEVWGRRCRCKRQVLAHACTRQVRTRGAMGAKTHTHPALFARRGTRTLWPCVVPGASHGLKSRLKWKGKVQSGCLDPGFFISCFERAWKTSKSSIVKHDFKRWLCFFNIVF